MNEKCKLVESRKFELVFLKASVAKQCGGVAVSIRAVERPLYEDGKGKPKLQRRAQDVRDAGTLRLPANTVTQINDNDPRGKLHVL